MKSGYKIFWSDTAIQDLKNIIDYLTLHWTNKEVRQFARKLDKRIEVITINPMLFPFTAKKNIRRSVLTKQIVIYYKTSAHAVTIITLFDARQNPKKLKSVLKKT